MTATTWETRDLPVLRVIVEMSDQGAWHIEPDEISKRTDIELETVKRALWALATERPPFFEYEDLSTFGGRDIGGVRSPTGHARRTVGTWPRPEDRLTEMVAALQEAAERESDPEKKSVLRKTAEYAAGMGRDLLIGILTNSVTGG